jgi:hypothetical protein
MANAQGNAGGAAVAERSVPITEKESSIITLQRRVRCRLAHRIAPPPDDKETEPGQPQQPERGLRVLFAHCDSRGEPTPRPLTAEEIEFERLGGFSQRRRDATLKFWTEVMWSCVFMPEGIVLILVPSMAVSSTKHGYRHYQTINFCYGSATLIGTFLLAQLVACYLRCVVVSAKYLQPPSLATVRGDPRGYVPTPEMLARALAAVARPSRLETVLAILMWLLQLEVFSIWLASLLYAQDQIGAPFQASVWLQFALSCFFSAFLVTCYPRVFRAIRVGIVRREKARVLEYVSTRWRTFVGPVLLLHLYVLVYVYVVLTLGTPPVGQALLFFSIGGGRRQLLCGDLDKNNCTLTFDPTQHSRSTVFTPYRPDAITCPSGDGIAGYESHYMACLMALVCDDIVMRIFMGVAASATLTLSIISLELLMLIPIAADSLFSPRMLLLPYRKTGISAWVKLTVLILHVEFLSVGMYMLLLVWTGIGPDLYPFSNVLLAWFGLPKMMVVSFLLTEFMRRRFTDTSSDMYTTLPGGRVVGIRSELHRLVRGVGERHSCGDLEAGSGVAMWPLSGASPAVAETRFASEAQLLVTGKPRDAALDLNWYMRVDPMMFAMPSYATGVAAIAAEFEAHGTETDTECLHYCLRSRAGSSSKRFDNGDRMRDCDAEGKLLRSRADAEGLGKTLADFAHHPAAVTAGLKLPHVLALRLYTTAAFRSLNNPLRETATDRRPHNLPVTVNLLKEAVSQLRAVEADLESAAKFIDLWRGLKNMSVAGDFLAMGGTELAPMSTTTSLAVAVQYSLSASSLILKVKTDSFMDRGADLSWVSAFPEEAEVLFPPLTFLQPTGRTMIVEAKGMRIMVVEVTPKH